jgi:hypothetical protein
MGPAGIGSFPAPSSPLCLVRKLSADDGAPSSRREILMVTLLNGLPSEITDACLLVDVVENDSGSGFLTLWTQHGKEINLHVDEKFVRLVIALNDAMLEDLDESEMARGWRRYDKVVRLVADRFHDAELQYDTFVTYASDLQAEINAAGDLRGVPAPLFIERKRGQGLRLTTDKLTIRYR